MGITNQNLDPVSVFYCHFSENTKNLFETSFPVFSNSLLFSNSFRNFFSVEVFGNNPFFIKNQKDVIKISKSFLLEDGYVIENDRCFCFQKLLLKMATERGKLW